jgi:hypothetical protein
VGSIDGTVSSRAALGDEASEQPIRIRDDGSVEELQYFTQQSRVCGNG